MIRLDTDPIGDSAGVERIAEEARFRYLADDPTAAIARIQTLETELAALKAGMVNRVGQVFLNAQGDRVRIVGFDDRIPFESHPWLAVNELAGNRFRLSSSGEGMTAGVAWSSLVGPVPDAEEIAQLKAESVRYLDEIKVLKRRRAGNCYTVDAPIRDINPCDVEAEATTAILQALDTAFDVQHMRLPILVQIAFAGDTNVAPLRLEGEQWTQFTGDVLWGASLVESEWKGGRFVGVYEVEAR